MPLETREVSSHGTNSLPIWLHKNCRQISLVWNTACLESQVNVEQDTRPRAGLPQYWSVDLLSYNPKPRQYASCRGWSYDPGSVYLQPKLYQFAAWWLDVGWFARDGGSECVTATTPTKYCNHNLIRNLLYIFLSLIILNMNLNSERLCSTYHYNSKINVKTQNVFKQMSYSVIILAIW